MSDVFDNKERRRYYGLRVGDIISCDFLDIKQAEVVEYGFMDNNAVYVKEANKKVRQVVAEWCHIITKVEDKIN